MPILTCFVFVLLFVNCLVYIPLYVFSDGSRRDQLNLFSKTQPPKKRRKSRTAFTNQQIYELEKRFLYQKYLTPADRDEIASSLGLTNAQVITWFQNRRAKLKRDLEELKADVTAAKSVGSESGGEDGGSSILGVNIGGGVDERVNRDFNMRSPSPSPNPPLGLEPQTRTPAQTDGGILATVSNNSPIPSMTSSSSSHQTDSDCGDNIDTPTRMNNSPEESSSVVAMDCQWRHPRMTSF